MRKPTAIASGRSIGVSSAATSSCCPACAEAPHWPRSWSFASGTHLAVAASSCPAGLAANPHATSFRARVAATTPPPTSTACGTRHFSTSTSAATPPAAATAALGVAPPRNILAALIGRVARAVYPAALTRGRAHDAGRVLAAPSRGSRTATCSAIARHLRRTRCSHACCSSAGCRACCSRASCA